MAEIKIQTNSGIRQFALEADLFQPFLPDFKPDFPLRLPQGIPTKEEVEDIADNLTKTLHKDQLPVDIDVILSYCGVTRISYHRELTIKTIKGSSHAYGYIEEAGDDYFIIRLNASEPPVEHAFTKGHELGHRILHETAFPIGEYKTGVRPEFKNQRPAIEEFCDNFARVVLAPRHLLLPRFEQIKDRNFIRSDYLTLGPGLFLNEAVIELFKEVQLPPWAFVWRLSELGLWKENSSWLILQGLLEVYEREESNKL